MRRLLFAFAVASLMAACVRAPSLPSADGMKGGGGQSAGDILVSIGYYAIGLGSIGLVISVGVVYFLGKYIGQGVAATSAGAIAAGLALVYVGPWLAWICAGAVLLSLAAIGSLAWRNRKRISDWGEGATGLDWNGDGIVASDDTGKHACAVEPK